MIFDFITNLVFLAAGIYMLADGVRILRGGKIPVNADKLETGVLTAWQRIHFLGNVLMGVALIAIGIADIISDDTAFLFAAYTAGIVVIVAGIILMIGSNKKYLGSLFCGS
ncbi:MAG: hypothetical protein LUE63_03455 [Lachnospiraceae bacterium]|nr:hypothetical protein [Lachnospiraceae bacterium]